MSAAIAENAQEQKRAARIYGLEETIDAFDADGNAYRRKISTGIKRGEFVVERSKDGVPLVYLVVNPTGINIFSMSERKNIRHELKPTDPNDPIRLCWYITEDAFTAAKVLQSVRG